MKTISTTYLGSFDVNLVMAAKKKKKRKRRTSPWRYCITGSFGAQAVVTLPKPGPRELHRWRQSSKETVKPHYGHPMSLHQCPTCLTAPAAKACGGGYPNGKVCVTIINTATFYPQAVLYGLLLISGTGLGALTVSCYSALDRHTQIGRRLFRFIRFELFWEGEHTFPLGGHLR